MNQSGELCVFLIDDPCDLKTRSSSDKEQLVEEEDDELKEVLDLRKIAVQLLQQEQQNRCVGLTSLPSDDTVRCWRSQICHAKSLRRRFALNMNLNID